MLAKSVPLLRVCRPAGPLRSAAAARSFSSEKSYPTSYNDCGMESTGKTTEEKRKMSRSMEDPIYKLGKHRSNALELLNDNPVIEVEGEMAICDGGGGPLGHPLEYISLARPGVVEYCKYCGLKFKSKAWEKYLEKE